MLLFSQVHSLHGIRASISIREITLFFLSTVQRQFYHFSVATATPSPPTAAPPPTHSKGHIRSRIMASHSITTPRFFALHTLANAPSAIRLRVRCDLTDIPVLSFSGERVGAVPLDLKSAPSEAVMPSSIPIFLAVPLSSAIALVVPCCSTLPLLPPLLPPLLRNCHPLLRQLLCSLLTPPAVASRNTRCHHPLLQQLQLQLYPSPSPTFCSLAPAAGQPSAIVCDGNGCYLWLAYWNIFTPSVAPKSNPTADITTASPRTSAASPRPLPFDFLPDSFSKAQRTYTTKDLSQLVVPIRNVTMPHSPSSNNIIKCSEREIDSTPFTLLMGAQCYLCSGDDLELSGAVLKLPVFIPLSKGASIVRCYCHRFLLAGTRELHLQLPRIMTSL
ncbi:hypothetical protein BHE74_00052236 [Ensete ventricosum]|nr:hypothetical protein BHE74_00052236 [Ensete ventricosum]